MNLLKGLNKNQKEAICHTKGPLLVIAGAGTGKTKVITHRIANLIAKGISPSQILAVTFTNKAAQEMKERIDNLIRSLISEKPAIGTFHSIAANILKKYGSHIDVPSHFSILSEKESFEIIKSIIEESGLNLRQFQPGVIQNLISQWKSSKSDFEHRNQTSMRKEFFPETLNAIREKYDERLKKQNAMDFDDLIQKTVLLFEQKPEILQICQEKWPYIHVDEYQDTDNAQYRLVRLLSRCQNNICAVGDDDQSIYGFRGADFTNILNFEKTWPDAKIVTLERNYRSTKKILNAANAAIGKNVARREKKLFTKEKNGTNLALFEAQNEKKEAEFIAGIIKKLPREEFSSTAILCRANFQFHIFEDVFRQNHLSYQLASKQDDLIKNDCLPRLMTIHAAKGLEFQNVFIPGLEKGLFPHYGGDSEEERRLFYVALTRAQEKIFLSWSRFRTAFGTKQINQPSQFLSDIPKSLIKRL